MNRNIDTLGRLVIPKEMRKQLGIKNCELVNIECSGDKIIITNPSEIDYKERIDKLKKYMNTLCDEYADDNYDIKCEVFNKIYYEILGDSNE